MQHVLLLLLLLLAAATLAAADLETSPGGTHCSDK
jgi:hypothetical protein